MRCRARTAPRLLTSTARVYFRPDRNVTGEIPVGFTFRAWDQSRGMAGQTASVGSLGDALSVIQAAAGLNIAMPGATLLEYGTDSSLVSLRQAAPAGDVAVRNEHVAPAVIESVTPGARVITLGAGPVNIVAPQGDVTIGRGGTGVLTVSDVPLGAMVSLETSFGVVTFDHTGRLLTGLTPHQLLTLSRITQLTVGANGAVFRVSGTV